MDDTWTHIPAIVQKFDTLLEHMTERHCKVLCVRMDVRFPDGKVFDEGNSHMSRFMKLLIEHHAYHGVEIHYLWVREKLTSKLHHYHVILLINGSLMQNPYGLFLKAEGIWERVLGVQQKDGRNLGLVNFCCHEYDGQVLVGHQMIQRPSRFALGSDWVQQDAIWNAAKAWAKERALYLAKTYSKHKWPDRIRGYQASQLPRVMGL